MWICGTNSDSLIRFDPERETFSVYPLPTRVTYTREIDFDAQGRVWTSNSNLPAWQIEGGMPRIIRLLTEKTLARPSPIASSTSTRCPVASSDASRSANPRAGMGTPDDESRSSQPHDGGQNLCLQFHVKKCEPQLCCRA